MSKKRLKKAARAKSRGPEWTKRELPSFSSSDDEERFWGSHEFASMASEESLTYEPRSGAQTRDHVYRVRLDDAEMAVLQVHARRNRVPASAILRNAVQQLARRDANTPMEISPSISAPLPDGAIAHVQVVNKGPFVARVRCWLRFLREDRSRLFKDDMPARWSCAPEPLAPIVLKDNSIVHIFDPSKMPLQGIADFARLEGHPVAVAIKFGNETWGWTPESYVHGGRHPAWRLPSERLTVMAVVLADGKVIQSEEFILDTSVEAKSFGVAAPPSTKRPALTDSEKGSEARAPTLTLLKGTG